MYAMYSPADELNLSPHVVRAQSRRRDEIGCSTLLGKKSIEEERGRTSENKSI